MPSKTNPSNGADTAERDGEFGEFMNYFLHSVGEELVSGRMDPESDKAALYGKMFPQPEKGGLDGVVDLAKRGLRQGKKSTVFALNTTSKDLAAMKRRMMEEGITRIRGIVGEKPSSPEVVVRHSSDGEPVPEEESMNRVPILFNAYEDLCG